MTVKAPRSTPQSCQVFPAEAALEDEEHVARGVRMNRQGMRQLTEAFGRMGLDHIPSLGNFVCVHVGGPAGPVYDRLLPRTPAVARRLAPAFTIRRGFPAGSVRPAAAFYADGAAI